MAAGFNTALRTTRATTLKTDIDKGGAAGSIKIYDGSRPATGGTVTTLLVTLPLSFPSGTVAAGVFTFAAITSAVAVATSTATWARILDSASTFVADVSVGTTSADIILSGTAVITTGNTVSITSGSITEGNA